MRKKKRKYAYKKLSIIILLGIVTIVAVYSGTKMKMKKYDESSFRYICKENNPCKTCNVTIGCIQFRETNEKRDFLYFTLWNNRYTPGDCYIILSIEKDGLIFMNKTYRIGAIEGKSKVIRKIGLYLPEGKSKTKISPYCKWD